MKLLKKSRFLIAAVVIVMVSTVLFAAFIFNDDTDSQPTSTLATFALSITDFSTSGGYAYQPWFENGAWQGDLIEYYVCGLPDEPGCKAGTRSTDAVIGSNPPVDGTNWMARATFSKNEKANPDYWMEPTQGGRHIFTVVDGSLGPQQRDFTWSNLSVAQKLALDSNTADPNNDFSKSPQPAASAAGLESPVLDFIRGYHGDEKSNSGGTYRIRYNLLGDIMNSNPVYIGAPKESYDIPGFSTFKSYYTDPVTGRKPRIAVGANDGMLHVFDPENRGREVYAYIPSMLIIDPDASIVNGYPVLDPATNPQLAESKLNKLRQIPYDHTYFVDGQLTAASAQINDVWYTVLTGGLGAGAKGVFALDVTDDSKAAVLFEKTGIDIGHIYGQPVVARLGNGKWYIVTGNGFGNGAYNTPKRARLLLISLDDHSIIPIDACEGPSCTPPAEGLAAAALVDTDGNYTTDLAYAGDDSGNMWRFNLRFNPDGSPNFFATRIFAGDPAYPDQPITSAPEIGAWQGGGYLVYFGTGTIAHKLDPSGSYPRQAIYGIWDSATGTKIVDQNLIKTTPGTFSNDGQTLPDGTTACSLPTDTTKLTPVRYFSSENTVDFCSTGTDCTQGWRVLLDANGEQVLGSPKLRAGRITVVTNNRLITGGDNWLMSLDAFTGGDGDLVVYDANLDDAIDDCDREKGGYPPVGLGLGDGNVSQPVFGHIAYGQDQMFINGLRLPILLSQGLIGGHLDVATDSPFGGSVAPNYNSQESESYNVPPPNDGAYRGVDGHFHHYDEVNGVTYVDLFQLEPLRGMASLAPKVKPYDGSSCDPGYIPVTEDGKIIGCIEAVVPELNRAYDTLTDPLTDPTLPKSEVYNDGTSLKPPLDEKKEFVLVLANADLSPAATLQIGCKEWTVEDYQDTVTDILETSPTPLSDLSNAGLVFTLYGIANDTNNIMENKTACNKNNPPTVRVKFNYRSILDGGVIGTRPQCVLGLHDYREPVCYSDQPTLVSAEEAVAEYQANNLTPASYVCSTTSVPDPNIPAPLDYLRDPDLNLHITQSLEGEGGRYRVRNGALNVQLIAVDSFKPSSTAAPFDCRAATYNDGCPLQDPKTLPKATTGKKKRFGGTYARAFSIDADGIMTPYASTDPKLTGNGLLYESSIYWHYGDLAENLRRAPPSSIPCYGATNYNGALVQEIGGLTLGEYNCLINGGPSCDYPDGIGDASDPNSLYSQYVEALETLQSARDNGDETLINQALLELGQLLADNPALAQYDMYRKYAPGHVPESKLLPIDKGTSGDGGEPSADVKLKETLDKSSLGPNLTAGRRSWIDLSD